MRVEHTAKLRGYSEYLVGERNPAISDRLYLKIFIWDDVPEDVAKQMEAKGAEIVKDIQRGCSSPPSDRRDQLVEPAHS